jgi:phospholipid N-methyltransferase
MNTIIGTDCSLESMFDIIGGWTTQFEINGKLIGGTAMWQTSPYLPWQIEMIGGFEGKRILELGPLEGAHTKTMINNGAREVIAVEGLSDCFLKCLIVKEAFHLDKARFIFGNFCNYVEDYKGEKFDLVFASGVLYHQINPAKLIHDLSKITDIVVVWSQVANEIHPCKEEGFVITGGMKYTGKSMHWGDLRLRSEEYCASLGEEAFWMYADEMRRCFKDAGFVNIIEKTIDPTPHGDCLLFIAKK